MLPHIPPNRVENPTNAGLRHSCFHRSSAPRKVLSVSSSDAASSNREADSSADGACTDLSCASYDLCYHTVGALDLNFSLEFGLATYGEALHARCRLCSIDGHRVIV